MERELTEEEVKLVYEVLKDMGITRDGLGWGYDIVQEVNARINRKLAQD